MENLTTPQGDFWTDAAVVAAEQKTGSMGTGLSLQVYFLLLPRDCRTNTVSFRPISFYEFVPLPARSF